MNKKTNNLTKTQQIALQLIKSDAAFLFSLAQLSNRFKSNFLIMAQPYIGVFVEGSTTWSNKVGLQTPILTKDENLYYNAMRNTIKCFNMEYQDFYDLLQIKFNDSDRHFSNLQKPIAKLLFPNQYYNVGVDCQNGHYCGNTILCSIYSPYYSYGQIDTTYIYNYSLVVGKIISAFEVKRDNLYNINTNLLFQAKDYMFFHKCPLKRESFDDFCLFSILCVINYLLLFVDKLYISEFPSKLRFAYLQYYYLLNIIPDINKKLNTSFYLDDSYNSYLFRNCMAHYGLGVAISDNEIIDNDSFGGLTNILFNKDCYTVKNEIYNMLISLSKQLEDYLF
mgnify:CR=1 FL=1